MGLFVKILVILLFIGLLIGIYLLVYYLNHKTDLPKGVKFEDLPSCESCSNTSCANRDSKNQNFTECEKKRNEK